METLSDIIIQGSNILSAFDRIKLDVNQVEELMKKLFSDVELSIQTKDFLINFSENSRDIVKKKLENIVNSALEFVFNDKKMKFIIMPNKTKKGLIYDLYIETNGTVTPILDAKGGGVVDIISLALRISFLRLFKGTLRQVLILDEPFKNLDGERIELAVQWLKEISTSFEIQFIIVTHIPELIQHSDKVYTITCSNDIAKATC